MTYTLDTPLSEAIAAAVDAGACEDDISLLRDLAKPEAVIGDLTGHPNGDYWAYWFAREVIKGRFEEGEDAIAKDAWYAFLYARGVIKGRFEQGEAAIAKDSRAAYHYAKEVIHGRFEAGEAAIAKDAWRSYGYAKLVIRGRFEAGEAAIAEDADYAPRYSEIPGVPSDWRAQA